MLKLKLDNDAGKPQQQEARRKRATKFLVRSPNKRTVLYEPRITRGDSEAHQVDFFQALGEALRELKQVKQKMKDR